MASKEKVNVIHRSNRGRNGVDVKTKTDSGCFVDDELEKQTQGEKSPTTKTDNIKITKTGTQDTNIIPFESSKRKSRSVRESDPNSVAHNVEGDEEMSQMNGRSEDTGIQDDFQSDLDFKRSVENTEPREDFYCLYYSDSPNGSLTRSKEKSSYVSSVQDDEDIGAKAEELLKKLKEDALKKIPNATSEVPEFQFRQGPSVAPKPKRTTKQQSGYAGNGRDPILAELEMLGPAVGRDFTSVETDENDESLLSNAVKELNLAQTTDECLDKFDAIQTALIETIPDTLERTKAKSKKDVPKRKSSSEANKAEMPSDFKMTEEKENSSDAKKKSNGKKAESPKPFKKKFESIKFSRTEVQSLNSMKKDSHHKRSHLNADNAKPVPTKSETYRLNKPDTSKRISERSESSKINLKKDPKVTSPKAGKPSPKKPNVSVGSKDVTKKRERLELRSSRRRRSGDLTSIPENAVMDDKNERRISDEVVPLAKEEDLSSDEDDEDLNEVVGDENDFPSQNPTGEENAKRQPYSSSNFSEDVIGLSSSGTRLNISTNYTLSEGSPASAVTRKNVIHDSSTLSSRLRREDKNVVSYSKHTHLYKQPGRLYDYRGRDQHVSDGWTSESTAGYSSECSANDADDETENFLVYGDPEDIVEMTFGSQIDEQPEGDDNYVFADESIEQPERDNFVEARDLASMYLHSEATQDEFEDSEFALQGIHYVQGGDAPAIYEYFEEPEDGLYHNTPEHSNSVSRCDDVDPRVPRQGARRNTSEEHIHSTVSQKPKKFPKEEGPDPSGFMTVQDIKRLIFQGTKPAMPRSTSFCGIPSSAALRKAQEQDTFQRKSWSGYGVRQQQEPGIDPLVRNFPQNSHSSQRLPKGKVSQSPYVRTVNRRSTPQVGYYSDTQLNAVNEDEIGYVECSGSFRRSPLQRRSHSLETYHSDNSIPDGVTSQSLVRRPARANVLIRSASDCSSNYSQGHANGQFQRKIENPSSNASPRSPYIDAEELAELVSSRASCTTGRGNVVTSPKQQQYSNSHSPQYTMPQSQRSSVSTFPRHSSESLRIQALRRASQRSSDNESDVYVPDGLPGKSNLDAIKTSRKKTLSERFTEVPQRISFEELVEKFDLGSDSDSEDEVDYRIITEKPESECGADLEFDNGDYFDDKNMIVGEAMRLKKVLGTFTEQDPELETLVSVTTDPKLPDPPQAEYDQTLPENAHKQPSEALIFESPPPYREVGRKPSETSESSSVSLVYDVPPLYESETESHAERTKMEEKLRVDLRDERKEYLQVPARKDSETQTNGGRTEKAISAEELLKILLNASQGSLQQVSQPPSQTSHQLVQNLCFPKPQTKAASTGNIHSEEKFPGHVSQLYGNSDLHSTRSSLGQRRHEPKRPTCHKSQECIRNKDRIGRKYGVLQAKMIGSEDHKKKHSKRIFEEEVDCMKTKNAFDFSSGEISTSGSSIDDLVDKKDRVTNVSFVGCEETKEIETLPRVKFSTQRKRRKSKTGYLSDQDIPTAVKNGNRDVRCEKSSENLDGESTKHPTTQTSKENGSQYAESEKESFKNNKAYSANQDFQRIVQEQNRPEVIDLKYYNNDSESYENILNESPHDSLPSPNSVNVFIDYNKKNIMKIMTSTPKIHHAKLVTQTPQGISPVSSDTGGQRTPPHENGSSFGEEEFPPSYETSPPSDRSSSVYSSDDDKFFGSSDTVVFVDKTSENSSVKPNVDDTTLAVQDQGASTSDDNAKTDEYSARVDSLFQEVRSSLDLDSIGSDLLDQAMERVKDKLSPRSSQDQGRGSITMEAFVALHQADELQAIINEIKGELWILQQENTFLKEKVVSLQHGEACSSSECTEDSLTESAERIDSIRRQIAAVVANKQRASGSEDELITVDVFLRGFGSAAGLKRSKKTDVKLGTVKVKGGTDWSGVYDAAKTTFLEHVKHIDPCSCLGLGPTSMYGAQIGATMFTPETLRRKNPRVEISRKFNSCIIQLKDGMTESFDTLIYDTLIPKPVLESFVRQILENRFIVLCGAAGLGKTFLATKLAEHLAQRFGSKNESPVLTLEVGQTSRKELKKTLAHLMKCDISSPSNEVPVVVILDQLDCLASLADIFDPKQLEGNRNSPFIIGVRNKSKKGPFSSKDLAVYKYFRWIQMSVHDRHVLGLLERFLRRKLSWTDNVEDEEDLLDLFLWLTQVWQRLNQILQSYVDIDVTIGPSVFYSCPMEMHAAEGWFANVWNYTIIPYLHQNLRNSNKIYERNVPWECPTKWVIMRWPWNRERSKVLATLKKLRQVDIVLNRNSMESTKGNSKGSHSKTRKLPSSKVPKNLSPSKAGSLESWSTADWDSLSVTSEVESIASSTL